MKNILIILILTVSPLAQALPWIIVRGVVVSFDQKKIVLKNGKSLINVPRSSYPDLKKVTVGHSVIEVRMNPVQMYLLNPEPKK